MIPFNMRSEKYISLITFSGSLVLIFKYVVMNFIVQYLTKCYVLYLYTFIRLLLLNLIEKASYWI